MPEVSQNQNPETTPPPPLKPKGNWKKIFLFLLLGLFLISVVGVGIWLLIPKITEAPVSPTQKQATPSAKPNTPSEFKNKIFLTWEEKIGENNYTNGFTC